MPQVVPFDALTDPMSLSALTLTLLIALSSGFVRAAEDYQIGAWYFPLWESGVENLQVRQAAKIYGRSDVWGGVRDYAEGKGKFTITDFETGRAVDYSSRRPLLGFYDLRSEDVIRAHISQAKSGGLSFFAFYWYWDGDQRKEPYSAIERFLKVDPQGEFRYVLAGITLGRQKISLDDWRSTLLPRLIDQYFSHPGYLKIGGRPVLIDFNLQFDTQETSSLAMNLLRSETKAKRGVEPLLIKRVGDRTRPEHLNYYASVLQVDGLTCFSFPMKGPAEKYQETSRRWFGSLEHWLAASQSLPKRRNIFIPCATTPFDSRPWYMIGWGPWVNAEYKTPQDRPYNAPTRAEEFGAHLQALKDFLARHPGETNNLAIVYAWNEWGEGGVLEPSAVDGTRMLDQVKKVFRSELPAN